MRHWHKYLIYISFLFLAIALYRADYLKIPEVHSSRVLAASFLFLYAGFIGTAFAWHRMLSETAYPVPITDAVAGIGLSIFSKYIPGKVWMIIGRAAYISHRRKGALSELSMISLSAQLITLWVGLILGAIGLFFVHGSAIWWSLTLGLWVFLSIVLSSRSAQNKVEGVLKALFRKELRLPRLTVHSFLSILPCFIIYWVFWSVGFYLLVLALSPLSVPWATALGFPLAGSLGIMTVFTPGGLGTREGVIVGYLVLAGLAAGDAATIAVSARLWFLLGEALMFLTGLVADASSRNG